MDIRAAVAQHIRSVRLERGLTLRRAAELADVSYTYIHALERASPTANITMDTLTRIVGALGGELRVSFGPSVAELTPEEQAQVRTFVRAIEAARQDPQMATVLTAVVSMLESRLPGRAAG